MQIKELKLNHFGKFHNQKIELMQGINLIYGENESGKSTIHTFIKGMLFGIEKSRGRSKKEDVYLKYQPWDSPGAYLGSMDIELNGKTYRIIRNFDKNIKSCTVIDVETGRELNLGQEELNQLYGGLSESGYRNTISIEQLKSRTDQELADEVRNYITNLTLTKSNEVDITKALNYLNDKRKEIESLQLEAKLKVVEEEINIALEQELRLDDLCLRLKNAEDQIKILRDSNSYDDIDDRNAFASVEDLEECIDLFPVIKEKYKSYNESLYQIKSLDEKIHGIYQQYNREFEANSNFSSNRLKEQIVTLEKIYSNITNLEENKKNLQINNEKAYHDGYHKLRGISATTGITFAIGSLLFVKKNPFLTPLFIIVAVLSGVLYGFLTTVIQRKAGKLKQKAEIYEKEVRRLGDEASNILTNSNGKSLKELQARYEIELHNEINQKHYKLQKQEYEEQKSKLRTVAEALYDDITTFIKKFPEFLTTNVEGRIHLSDNTITTFEAYLKNMKAQIVEKRTKYLAEYEAMRIETEKLRWEIESLAENEDKLLIAKDRQKELLKQKKEKDKELKGVYLAIETIQELSIQIHDSFGLQINKLVSDFAGAITEKYNNVKLDEKLNIKVEHKDNLVVLEKLSAGTIEQLFLTLRLAIADIFYGKDNMPILLDDCFAFYDDNRTKAALKLLSQERSGQVIIFTCHNREKEILEKMNIKHHFINLSRQFSHN